MSNLLDRFGLDNDIFSSIADEPEIFAGSGKTTMFQVGKRTPYSLSINGTELPGYVTVHEASLTRLSLLRQFQVSRNREYNLVTGIMKPVRMDVEVIIDDEAVNLIDVLHQIVQSASNKSISREEFIHTANRIGLKLNDGMPLFFQQFGASQSGFDAAAEILRSYGAVDQVPSMTKNTRIVEAWALKDTGIPVSAFELGTVDRTESARYNHDKIGQGFLNLAEAQIEQLTRIVGLRKAARAVTAQIAELGSDAAQADIKALGAQKKVLTDMATQWTTNWAGAQRRLVKQKNGTFVEENIFDPVNAPCGRFTLETNNGSVDVDLWTNSLNANTSSVVVSDDTEDDDDDAPF
jgi:hypothetical protein